MRSSYAHEEAEPSRTLTPGGFGKRSDRSLMQNTRLLSLMLLAVVWLTSAATAAPLRRSAQLLPATTRAYLSIANTEALQDRWSRTQLAELTDAPALQAFRAQIQRRIDQ